MWMKAQDRSRQWRSPSDAAATGCAACPPRQARRRSRQGWPSPRNGEHHAMRTRLRPARRQCWRISAPGARHHHRGRRRDRAVTPMSQAISTRAERCHASLHGRHERKQCSRQPRLTRTSVVVQGRARFLGRSRGPDELVRFWPLMRLFPAPTPWDDLCLTAPR